MINQQNNKSKNENQDVIKINKNKVRGLLTWLRERGVQLRFDACGNVDGG